MEKSMSVTTDTPLESPLPNAASATPVAYTPPDPTDKPIPVWPDGVLLFTAIVTTLCIGLRHRAYLERKFYSTRRAIEEFQAHGGVDEVTHIARSAAELLRGATGKDAK
jgi:hypothetical protein